MNMATIATGAVCCGVVEAETAASLVALSGNLCSDKSPPPSTPSRGAAGASPPTFESRARSSKNACTPRPKRSRNSTHARTWSAPRRGREPRVQRPRRQRRRRDVPRRHRAGRGRRSSRARTPSRPPRCRTATSTSRSPSPPSKSAPSAAARNSDAVRGASISRRQRRRRPAGSNADALARCIAVGSLAGELSLLSALASRHLSSAHAELGR